MKFKAWTHTPPQKEDKEGKEEGKKNYYQQEARKRKFLNFGRVLTHSKQLTSTMFPFKRGSSSFRNPKQMALPLK